MKLKKGFTLGEMLVVFVIIGLVATIGLHTVKPWEKAYKYAYHRMYNAFSLAIYNHLINTPDTDAFPQDSDALCKMLLDWINTAENVTTCSGTNVGSNPKDDKFTDDTMRFKASNGFRIWIGAQDNKKPFELNQNIGSGQTDKVRYYMVYVDINGDRRPNSAEWTKNRMADIVAFVITDKFRVVPLGYPEVDTRYMDTHVVYPSLNTDYSEGDSTSSRYTGDEDVVSDPMSYYEAKMQAFGGRVFPGNIKTYDFRSALPSDSYFRVDDYTKYYTTAPALDTESCPLEAAETSPICDIKIYDYH